MCGTGTYLDELDDRTPALAQALADANRKARECSSTIVPDWVANPVGTCQATEVQVGPDLDAVEKENR